MSLKQAVRFEKIGCVKMTNDVFGEKLLNQTYVDREGVYAIILNDKNEVATVRLPHGYFLPGGGLEGFESKEECLRRECIEELGWNIEINQFVCKASNYYYSVYRHLYLHATGHFYLATKLEQIAQPIECDHELVWLSLDECLSQLHLDHQAWAVEKAMQLM